MDEPKYKRVLLKISGEALAGEKHFGLDFQVLGRGGGRHQGVRGTWACRSALSSAAATSGGA